MEKNKIRDGKILAMVFLLCILVFYAFKPPGKSVSIYTIGDSTMSDKKPEVYPETGWCQVLGSFFTETVRIHNHAVNGRSTKSFIDEGRWQVVLDSLKKGDYVFIQFGHNDQKDQDSTRFTTPFGSYTSNLEKFVNETRAKEAIPVLFTSIVRRKFGEDGRLADTHGDYPEAMREVARNMDVPLVDLQRMTESWINALGDEASKPYFLWTTPDNRFPNGRKDDTHLSREGALAVARMAVGGCKNLGLEFTAFEVHPNL